MLDRCAWRGCLYSLCLQLTLPEEGVLSPSLTHTPCAHTSYWPPWSVFLRWAGPCPWRSRHHLTSWTCLWQLVPSHPAKRKAGCFLCSRDLRNIAPSRLFAKRSWLFMYGFLLSGYSVYPRENIQAFSQSQRKLQTCCKASLGSLPVGSVCTLRSRPRVWHRHMDLLGGLFIHFDDCRALPVQTRSQTQARSTNQIVRKCLRWLTSTPKGNLDGSDITSLTHS